MMLPSKKMKVSRKKKNKNMSKLSSTNVSPTNFTKTAAILYSQDAGSFNVNLYKTYTNDSQISVG